MNMVQLTRQRMLPKPEHCLPCPLYGDGRGFSSLEGYGDSKLIVIADSLGENEEEDGLPLRPQGASGKVFRRALRESGLNSQRMTITNIVRCRPPDNELWGHPWTFAAIDRCSRYLNEAIAQRKPRIILALGDSPYGQLSSERPGPLSAMRGFVLKSVYGIPLIATYHPSYIARGAWKLYGTFKHDVAFAAWCANNGVPPMLETNYDLHPTDSSIRDFLDWLRANPMAPFSYDVETAGILGEPEPDDWRLKRLIQIQFSVRPGHAIVLPWNGPGYDVSRVVFALSNPRWGWNSRLSDDIVLEANGIDVTGQARSAGFLKGIDTSRGTVDGRHIATPPIQQEPFDERRQPTLEAVGPDGFGSGAAHDLMLAWAHLQPDFASKGDDRDGDEKGIPSKLMGLQSAASFYCPEVGPWKHLAATNLPLYGAFDSDYTYRCGVGIFRELNRLGLSAGYQEHKYELRWVLDDLGSHGLPVDRDKQADLRAYALEELSRIQLDMHARVPASVLSIHPKTGYKALHSKVELDGEKVALKAVLSDYDPSQPPIVTAAGHTGYLVQRDFVTGLAATDTIILADGSEDRINAEVVERRWCIERLYNPHASSPNTKSYIRAMGYRMPTKIDDPDKETTGRNELRKLAKETGDEVLALTDQWRELRKTGLDYTTGKWVPGDDGRIHPTFRCGTTGSGQTSCTDPNAQQYPEHSGIAKRAKEAVRAEPGHLFVKNDMRGFHSRAIGWLANDPVYYDLADKDVHAYVTAHFLQLHDAPYLLEMSDEEQRSVLSAVKREYGYVRNYKVKRVTHGRQFNMGVRKLYDMHADDFNPTPEKMIELVGPEKWSNWDRDRQLREIAKLGRRESTKLFHLFDELFPQTFVAFPAKITQLITEDSRWRLVSAFGHHRFFWNYDLEQSTAFLPSNSAHCHIQSALVRLRYRGALRLYGACNFTHDALWLHTQYDLVDDCVTTVQSEFDAPSTVLVDSPLGPFQCNSDAEIGPDLAHMVSYDKWVKAGRPTAEKWSTTFPAKETL